ncbi:hypothetical protein [Streptomyces sp. ME109]|uniref:hypothetical protein n=1 Tax=Streptomyces sp. me109 TaxID=1827853 RepID=UPI00165109A8|nr:hypothetical protein [Streptomyces sp. me109]
MTSRQREVPITGRGLITPAGVGREATRKGIPRGRSTAPTGPELKDPGASTSR